VNEDGWCRWLDTDAKGVPRTHDWLPTEREVQYLLPR
jgi:hypothetical protein